MPAIFPLGVATDDLIVFNALTQMWERGVGEGCPPVIVPQTFDITIPITSSVSRSFSATQLDSPTFSIRTDSLDAPSGTLLINGVVIVEDSGGVMAVVTVDFDSSSSIDNDVYYLEVTNVGGCSAITRVSISAV